jgi:hypothetical protein
MDPKLLLFLPGLATCPTLDAQPMLYISIASPAPTREWPELPDLPEGDHPAHGEGSSESPMYQGVGGYVNANTSNRIVVDSSASGNYNSLSPQAVWLANRFPLVTSTRDLDVEPLLPAACLIKTFQVAPDTTKHLTNLSTLRTRRTYGRHRS